MDYKKLRVVYLFLVLSGVFWLSFILILNYSAGYVSRITFTMCVPLPSATLIFMGIGLWYRERIIKRHWKEARDIKVAHLKETQDIEAAHRREIQDLTSARIEMVEKMGMERWFQSLASPPWQDDAREVEIEVKFVFPLLKYLGYKESEMSLRVPVLLQEGRRETTLEADWTLRDGSGNTLVVVEAKAPDKQLTEAVRKQACSYAFHLGAPVYITTNGEELRVFHRGVLTDRCIVSCSTSRLGENWEAIQQAAGKSSVRSIKRQLSEKVPAINADNEAARRGMAVLQQQAVMAHIVAEDVDDELLQKAIALVRSTGSASASLLQRRLRIGHPRAARLMQEMEEMGIIGPPEAAGRTRRVIIGDEEI